MTWLTVIGLILTCAIGIWKYFSRKKSEKRKICEEARKEYEDAVKSADTSAIAAAMSRINRVCDS